MLDETKATALFVDYYAQWVQVYKEGAIREVTLAKYKMTQAWLKKLVPELQLCNMTRITYQQLINNYAQHHERQTTMDFHHQLKGAILDAVDEGLIDRDPTRKVIIKGKTPAEKKIKYLNQFELHTLLKSLDLGKEVNWDWFILLVAKPECVFRRHLPLHRRILILRIRHYPSAKRGITREMVAFFQQKTSHLYGKFRLTGRRSCSLRS